MTTDIYTHILKSNSAHFSSINQNHTSQASHHHYQDSMTSVRHRLPFLAFNANLTWDRGQQLLLPGQSAVHSRDIIACVFGQRLNFPVDCSMTGEVFAFMYWQKRKLLHA